MNLANLSAIAGILSFILALWMAVRQLARERAASSDTSANKNPVLVSHHPSEVFDEDLEAMLVSCGIPRESISVQYDVEGNLRYYGPHRDAGRFLEVQGFMPSLTKRRERRRQREMQERFLVSTLFLLGILLFILAAYLGTHPSKP